MKKDISLRISNYSYFLMMLFLPLSLLFDNIFLIILFITTIFGIKKERNYNVIYCLILFFVFTFLNGILHVGFALEQENYIKLLPFLILPFCIENLDNAIKMKGLFFLFIGIIVIQVNSVYGILNYYYFSEGKKYALKNYSKVNEILNYERPYLGFFSSLNIIICYYFFSIKRKRVLSVIISIFSLVLIIVISARLAIIVVFLSGIIVLIKDFSKKKIIIALLLFASIISFIFISKSSLTERFNQIGKDARVVTWVGAIQSFQNDEKYVFGSGSQKKTRIDLLEYYKNHKGFISLDEKNRFITKNYNTHNQYINELLRGGVLGLLILLIPQLFLLYLNFQRGNTLAVLFLTSIISFCLVENVLDRQVGVYLYVLLLSFSNIYKKLE